MTKPLSRRRSRRASAPATRLTAVAAAIALLASTASLQAADLPTGASIVGGTGSIAGNGNSLTITQSSPRLATDWQSFSIGAGRSVNFVQPSAQAVALNRVLGSEVSVIQGALNANGQVFLVNPNGVLFTPTAQVNVGGIVASTLNVATADFMAGNDRFSGQSANAVINQGRIKAAGDAGQGGSIALIAARIRNEGTLAAPGGKVLMAAGSEVLLDLGGPAAVAVSRGALDALIEQGGVIQADGGLVYLTAQSLGTLAATVIRHTGVTEAQTLATGEKGGIYLLGGLERDRIEIAGTLDASAPRGGNGGFIETSSADLRIAPATRVTTQAPLGSAGQWLIDPTDFTIFTGSADQSASGIGATTLQNALAGGSVSIATSAAGSGAGDIHVNAALAWSANTLSLTAHRDINVNAVLTADGSAGLALTTGNGGRLNMAMGASNFTGRVDFTSSGDLAINGVTATVIRDAAGLQAVGSNLGGLSVLGGDIDLASAAFTPIGTTAAAFSGQFNGLGHRISNLSINLPSSASPAGLFGAVAPSGLIGNVNLASGTVTGNYYAGGLVGINKGSILNSYSAINVRGSNYVGGLAGSNSGGAGVAGGGTAALIAKGIASGSVSGASYVGGLVGHNAAGAGGAGNTTASGGPASIEDSSATGSVTNTNMSTGGLVGYNQNGSSGDRYTYISGVRTLVPGGKGGSASIKRSFASGTVTSVYQRAGGLVGENSGDISLSYSTSNVPASHAAGGLVGVHWSTGTISDSYARGNVSGNSAEIGGLVGILAGGSIARSYATGTVTGSASSKGGLIGDATTGSVTNSYWDTQTSGMSTSAGGLGSGLTTLQMTQQLSGLDFSSAAPVWGIASSTNGGYPFLCTFGGCALPVITVYVKPTDGTSIYGSTPTFTYTLVDSGGSLYSLSNASITGSAVYSAGAPTAASNAGSYTFTYGSGLALSGGGASGYTLTPWAASSNWIVSKAPLTVAANAASKTYGDANPALSATLSGFVNGQTLATSGVSGSASVTTTATALTDAGAAPITVAPGSLSATNYDFTTFTPATLSIERRPLTLTASAASKIVGQPDPALGYRITAGMLVGGDTLNGSLSRNAGENVGSYSIDAGALAHGNYRITAINGVFVITPQAVRGGAGTTPGRTDETSIAPPPLPEGASATVIYENAELPAALPRNPR